MVLGWGAGPPVEACGISLQAARAGRRGWVLCGEDKGAGCCFGGMGARGRVVSGRLGTLMALKASWGQEVGEWRTQEMKRFVTIEEGPLLATGRLD